MAANTVDYPAKITVDYPDRLLNRLTSFFRIFTAIPIAIILCLLTGPGASWRQHAHTTAGQWEPLPEPVSFSWRHF